MAAERALEEGFGGSPAIDSRALTVEPPNVAIGAAGDCTRGQAFESGNGKAHFERMLEQRGERSYPSSRVSQWLQSDEPTLANWEAALTDSFPPTAERKFHFRSNPARADILVESSVGGVSVSNHQTWRCRRGYRNPLAALEEAGGGTCGNGVVDHCNGRAIETVCLAFVGPHVTKANVRHDIVAGKRPDKHESMR